MNSRIRVMPLAVALGSGLGSMTAFGEDSDRPALEEVVVTATKRTESLQAVPLSVTAFSQDQLDIKGASNLTGIQESTPNLNFSVQSAGQNVARVTLRGIGTETLVGGGDPGVALHIDGVYVGRNSAAAGDVFDVERVEVLRGPQGTLYGRNATGGSINLISKRPTDETEGYVDYTVGNYNESRVRGVVNVPLTENLTSRIAIFSESHDGYMENLFENGRDNGDKDSHGGRLQLRYETDSGNEFLLRGYYSKTGGAGPGSRYLGTDLNTPNGYAGGYLIGVSGGPRPPAGGPIIADAYGLGATSSGAAVLPLPTDLHQVRKNAPEFVDMLIKGFDFEANVELTDGIVLKTITSYQTNDNEILVDSDGSELAIETRNRDNQAKQYSQEFNLISQDGGAFQWLVGAYYYHEELTERFDVIRPVGLVPAATPLPPGAVPGGGGTRQIRVAGHEVDSAAVFAQISYDITEDLSVTVGARYTKDDKDQFRSIGGQIDTTNGIRFRGGGAVGFLPPDSGSTSFSETSYRVSADYQLTNDNLLFASYARGYKSGGFDFNGGQISGAGDQLPYDPEFVTAIEIGSKNKFYDDRVILNLTVFDYDYEDLQVFRLTGFGPLTDNAAQSTIQGVEVEFRFAATDNLSFDGSYGYLDATYDQYTIDLPPTDFSGNTLNYAPENTAHIGVEYAMAMSDGDLIVRLDWSYRSDIYFDRANSALDTQEAYSLLNARLRYEAESYYVDFWGKNLGDETYVTGQLINPPFSCGCRTVNVGAPRTYGVTVGTRF